MWDEATDVVVTLAVSARTPGILHALWLTLVADNSTITLPQVQNLICYYTVFVVDSV